MITQNLLIQVAAHLSGRPVVAVRLQEPCWNNASGACFKTMDFKAVIDLNPGADVFFTFLHECAHLKFDWPAMTPSDYWKAEPGSIRRSDEVRKGLNALPREDKANVQAGLWSRYSIENCWKYQGDNMFEKQLKALLNYPSE
jgi:hypothetical protein